MTSSSVVQHTKYPTILKGDSGASNHYVTPAIAHKLKNTHINSSITVTLPDETIINLTQSGNLNLPNLSTKATLADVLPHLSTSLLSLGQLANDGCIILLTLWFPGL